ncbi:outer membrane adhesin-like protein, partial [Mycobacterium sp. PO2]
PSASPSSTTSHRPRSTSRPQTAVD